MEKLEFLPRQLEIMESDADELLIGGARGGGKSFTNAAKMSIDVVEWYNKTWFTRKKLNEKEYRKVIKNGEVYYYKLLIDYPEYMGVIVRKTDPELRANTKVECDKIYKIYGGRWLKGDRKYEFPSGASIWLRPCSKEEHLGFFIGANFMRLSIEELTQFDKEYVDVMNSCCRSTHKHIKAKKVYTTNPGQKGHLWVKKHFVDLCPPLADGDRVYLEKYDLHYQPLRGGDKARDPETGLTVQFIPSLVFDNPHLAEKNENYVRYLMGLNNILREMWLFGNWNVFAGQFFDMWDENIHVLDELEFYSAKDKQGLRSKKLNFDWSNYRLYRSYDYGYAEKSAWACGAYAVNNKTNQIIKFDEIIKSKLTAREQARYTNQYFETHYNLFPEDFEMEIADPKSFWQNMDSGDGFVTAWDYYNQEGISLIEGINKREQGAMAMLEVLRIREDKTSQMQYMSCCKYSRENMPNLPADPKNPNDVDTKSEDHGYDSDRYFVMKLRASGERFKEKKKKGWRERLGKINLKNTSWKVA